MEHNMLWVSGKRPISSPCQYYAYEPISCLFAALRGCMHCTCSGPPLSALLGEPVKRPKGTYTLVLCAWVSKLGLRLAWRLLLFTAVEYIAWWFTHKCALMMQTALRSAPSPSTHKNPSLIRQNKTIANIAFLPHFQYMVKLYDVECMPC